MKKAYFLLLLLHFNYLIFAQEQHHVECKHFRISPVLSHTYIPMATKEGDKTVIVPSFGLDLEYWFSNKWGFGLHNDLELETFEIMTNNELTIEKQFPVVLTADVLYRFHKNWILVFGSGIEFEKNENLFIIRTGIEYEVEFGNHWDIAPTVFYDHRSHNFGTWSIGIGIGKRF